MDPINKTLVIRFSSIGDILLTSPLLRLLRARFPKGQIDFVTRKEYAELVKFNHNINRTFEFDASGGFEGLRKLKKIIREEQYDLMVDLHDSLRSRYLRSIRGPRHVVVDKRVLQRSMLVQFKKNLFKGVVSVVDRYIETMTEFGVENDGKGLELFIPDEILFKVSGQLSSFELNRFEKVIALCPGARHFTKRWPAERFARLGAAFVQKLNAKVLLLGGVSDEPLCRQIAWEINNEAGADRASSLAGKYGLLETAAAMQFCDAVVTNDSGLMHIATAMQRRIVAIFGSTVREFGFFPYDPSAIVIENRGLGCRPCSHIGRSSCPEHHFRCMTEIEPEHVLLRTRELLE